MRRAYFYFIVFLTLQGCGMETPDQATRIIPPSSYVGWWNDLQKCSRLRGNFHTVRFYTVPNQTISPHIVGRAYPEYRSIYLDEFYQSSELVVKHEMMHVLVGADGHPVKYFRQLCGNLMADSAS